MNPDSRLRAQVSYELRELGHQTEVFDGLNELDEVPPTDGVILIVLEGGRTSVAAALAAYRSTRCSLPPVICSRDSDIAAIVESIRLGSFDFIEFPIVKKSLDRIVGECKTRGAAFKDQRKREIEARAALINLSPREMEVFESVVRGLSNKEIATDLGISVRTLESHRLSLMRKMDATCMADLFRIWSDVGGQFETWSRSGASVSAE